MARQLAAYVKIKRFVADLVFAVPRVHDFFLTVLLVRFLSLACVVQNNVQG